MAKFVKGVRVTRLDTHLENDDTGYTRFSVRGLSPSIYVVTVDSENLWTCSCKSSKYRNLCYHILMVKTEIERISILKRLVPVTITAVSPRDFNRYYAMDRFISEAIYGGPREFIIIGRRVWLGYTRKEEWEDPKDSHVQLAGTVLEGIWDRYGVKNPVFRLIDCLFFKGIDHRLSPLAYRKDLLDSLEKLWLPPSVEIAKYYYASEKDELMNTYGCCILKDINSSYDRTHQSPRAWLEVKRDGKVHSEEE